MSKKNARNRGAREPGLPLTVSFTSLGCPKNLVDSERMLAVLGQDDMALVPSGEIADVTVINTCGFIEDARQEAYECIQDALEQKHNGEVGRVVVAGCLAQYQPDQLRERFPDIDAVVGLAHRDQLHQIIRGLVAERRSVRPGAGAVVRTDPFRDQVTDDRTRLRLTAPSWAYLRIAEGCSMGCRFCSIPRIRGPFRSKNPREILAEAQELIETGAIELNLIAQETTSYGRDIDYKSGLAGILRELNALEPLGWLRVLYAHPASLTDEIIDSMGQCDKVLSYLDLPLQHISDRLLEQMNRHVTRAQTERLLDRLRSAMPDLAVRTTLIVGYPSESDEEFQELLEFVRQQRFTHLGVFVYSPEPGTAAAGQEPRIDPEIADARLEALMLAQQEIAFADADALAGREFPCLLTDELPCEDIEALGLAAESRWLAGRLPRQAPESDSLTFVACPPDGEPPLDTIVPVRIIGRQDYDLLAAVLA
ncbi:MAG: 30S ribosomal protein S12 methylthiotransferase RimO [Sedimentisphaerales bacterium]|nr:30S ribosomal protein S12 methylthiotransferase RimO [Sedimentisphaerales bacterium]